MFKSKKGKHVLTKLNIKRYIKNGILTIPDGITEIAPKAAFENTLIEKVIIPSSVKEIGSHGLSSTSIKEVIFESRILPLDIQEYAFSCTMIKSVKLPDNVFLGEGCFRNCEFLEYVELGINITEIPDYCFKNTSLKEITFFEQVEKIGVEAFSDTSFSEITLPINIDKIEKKAFSYNNLLKLVRATNLQEIPEGMFEGCKLLEKVEITYQNGFINKGVKIGSCAFSVCNSLKEIEFQGGGYIYSIGDYAFLTCHELRTIDLSFTKTIGANAFSGAKNLRDIGELKLIENIGSGAFRECHFLNNVELGKELLTIGNSAFFNCKRLNQIEIPEYLRSIGESVFEGCTNLEKVKIMARELEALPKKTFFNCKALKEVIMNEVSEICRIEDDCFSHCTSLTNIEFLKKLEEIGSYAFSYCNSMVSIVFEGNNLVIKDDAFSNCARLRTVEIKGTIEYIQSAFFDCPSLTTITIPLPDKIGENFVSRCRKLEKIQFQSEEDVF